jgi:hypothetical protein
MDENNVIEMPVKKNILDGTVHIFKTKEQMDAIKAAKEKENATEENSN